MTSEESIEVIKQDIPCEHDADLIEALEMAIQALSQEPCENCCNGNQIEKAKLCQKSYLAGMEHKQEPCTDAIDRAEAQTAIMMSKDAYLYKGHPTIRVSDAVQAIRELPSVIPTQTNTLENTLGDAISRREALKCLNGTWGDYSVLNEVFERINELPSVTPKPDNKYRKEAKRWKNKWLKLRKSKTGHWIGIDEEPHEDFECDVCGYVCSTFTANIKPSDEYKYCPNCGVKMQERSGKEV